MRKIKTYTALAIMLFSMNACTKDGLISLKKVPDNVKSAFNSAYTSANDVEWYRDGDLYIAEFEQNGQEIEVTMNENGQVIEIETEIAVSELPAAISVYIAANYPNAEIEEAERIEQPNQNGEFGSTLNYSVEIETEEDDDHEEELELLFDANGNFLSIESENDDDEDNCRDDVDDDDDDED